MSRNLVATKRLLTGAATVLALASIAMPASAAPQHPASHPSISALTVSPSTVAHGGGTVHLKATVHHATHCKVSSSPSLPNLPVTHSCSSGHVAVTLHVGADPSAALRHFTITVKATKGSHHTTKTVKLTQAAAPAPTVTGFAVSPVHLASSGGTVHLTATVKHASSCKLSASPTVSGLPATVACTSQTFNHAVALPADTTSMGHTYLFTLKATGPGGAKTASNHPMATVAASAGVPPETTVSATGAPLPADAGPAATLNASLAAVSCPAAGHCIAVGQYYAPETQSEPAHIAGLIETLSGTTWTPSAAPVPSDISTTEPAVEPTAVSCASPTNCAIVGDYVGNNGGLDPYVATLSGTTWTWQPAPTPTDESLPSARLGGDLTAVSCVTDGCVAVGGFRPPEETDPLIESSGASGWTGASPTLPLNADTEEQSNPEVVDVLKAVSCTTSTSCTAVGEYTTGTGESLKSAGLGETLSGSIWSPSELPPSDGDDEGYDSSVSCAGNDCVGTGNYDISTPKIQTEVSGVWGDSDDITAPQPTTANGADLNAVDCTSSTSSTSSTSCVLVGTANNPTAGSYGLIESGSGTSYTPETAPVPSNAVTGQVGLAAVSCPAAGTCGAVGDYQGSDAVHGDADSLLDTESTTGGTSTWTPNKVPIPTGGVVPGSLESVSCVAGWGCAAVGTYTPDGAGATANGEVVTAPL